MIEVLPTTSGSQSSDDAVATMHDVMALDLIRRRFPMHLEAAREAVRVRPIAATAESAENVGSSNATAGRQGSAGITPEKTGQLPSRAPDFGPYVATTSLENNTLPAERANHRCASLGPFKRLADHRAIRE